MDKTFYNPAKVNQFLCFMAFCIMGFSISGASEALENETIITNVRIGLNNGNTRFVFETNKVISPTLFFLEANEGAPRRLVIDIPNAISKINKPAAALGSVSKYRSGQYLPELYRLVLELKEPVKVIKNFTLPPTSGFAYRTVIDLEPTTLTGFAEQIKKTSLNRKLPKPIVTARRNSDQIKPKSKRVIVIDPGHGGGDPGNLGSVGVHEDKIVYAISKKLEALLESDGRFDARLTRGDGYKKMGGHPANELRRRIAFAQNADADLFISVHADSFKNREANGATIYTLAEKSSDKEAARLVNQHNNSGMIKGLDVEPQSTEVMPILLDLAIREKMNASARFAEILLPELKREVNMRSYLPHKSGPFMVLKDPVVPSVLIEAGFLTNKKDGAFLKSTSGQKKVASAIDRAVTAYFRQLALYDR